MVKGVTKPCLQSLYLFGFLLLLDNLRFGGETRTEVNFKMNVAGLFGK
jgi:hypothetical protein